ncbi:MAG: hypothetical protein NTZ78_09325 [Candidatus Aureabacteria bacterium]|nr:hypothetical protein [Candidatus Auribacterota bacterium]
MRATLVVILSVMFAAGLCGTVVAGSIDSPGLPTAGSGMYTLQNLYDYLTSGTALMVQTSFQEPASGPGSTMKSTKEIGDAIKDKFNLCAATTDNVEQGVTFFCTQPGSWGVQTGTLVALPRPTATPTSTATPTATPTPTWGQTRCEAKGGLWAPLNGGLVGNGCWFKAAFQENCSAACGALTLGCDTRQWNDNGTVTCSIMRQLGPSTCSFCQSGGSSMGDTSSPAIGTSYWEGTGCIYRPDSVSQACDATINTSDANWGKRICVCNPEP